MVRIGTWNLENLFTPRVGRDRHAYEAKLASLAGVIADLAPDVLAVQEVGDRRALADLVARLPGTWHIAMAAPDRRGIRVGVLSRLALAGTHQIRDHPPLLALVQVDDRGTLVDRMGRPALCARIDCGGRSIEVISAHLKSKLLSYPGGRFSPRDEAERVRFAAYALNRRTAEAAAVRGGVDALLQGHGRERAVIVAGDLNDEPEAATTQILLGPGGSEIGTAGFARPDPGDAHRLWNLAPLVPEDQRFTRVYRGRGEFIDHLLVSHALVRTVTTVTTGALVLPSIADNPSARRGTPGSDHRPVVATFDP